MIDYEEKDGQFGETIVKISRIKGCRYLLMQTQPLDGDADRRFLLFFARLRSTQPPIGWV